MVELLKRSGHGENSWLSVEEAICVPFVLFATCIDTALITLRIKRRAK
jgi:hypothetical protein